MNSIKSVALMIETSNEYARGLLRGIVSYLEEHGVWAIHLPEQGRGADPPGWLKNWQGDGIIARIETEPIANAVKILKIPIVDVSSARLIPDLPWVETDDNKIAELAFEHLGDRYQSLAFCGVEGFNWSKWRKDSFEKLATRHGIPFSEYTQPSRISRKYSANRERRKIADWIRNLDKPVGLFACYDIQAQTLLDICREQDIDVPEDVAILGVDNDELLCKLCKPKLSSVIPDTHTAGYEAARLLDSLMEGKRVKKRAHLIPPIGIANRQSTELMATSDAEVNIALRWIKEHVCDGIGVKDLLSQIPISRRSLEHRFVKTLGRTPHQEINRQRMIQIKKLLLTTNLSLATVAKNTGFRSVDYMSVFFKREMKIPPGSYRRKFSG